MLRNMKIPKGIRFYTRKPHVDAVERAQNASPELQKASPEQPEAEPSLIERATKKINTFIDRHALDVQSEAVKASMEARKTIKEKTMTNEHHLDPKDEKIISYVSEKAPRPIIGLQDEKGGLDLTDRDQPYWRDAPKKKEK